MDERFGDVLSALEAWPDRARTLMPSEEFPPFDRFLEQAVPRNDRGQALVDQPHPSAPMVRELPLAFMTLRGAGLERLRSATHLAHVTRPPPPG